MKSTEIHSRFSKEVASNRAGQDQYDDSIATKSAKSASKTKTNTNATELQANSSFRIGPGGQRDLISS